MKDVVNFVLKLLKRSQEEDRLLNISNDETAHASLSNGKC